MAAESLGVDPRIIRQILKEYIKVKQAIIDSGAYSLEQEREARDKIRQASMLNLYIRSQGEDFLP